MSEINEFAEWLFNERYKKIGITWDTAMGSERAIYLKKAEAIITAYRRFFGRDNVGNYKFYNS